MISLRHVTKSFGGPRTSVRALDDVSLDVAEGEIFGVVGQSGAGKSTLIRTVNLLERPDSGTVTVDGRELTSVGDAELRAARQRIGMVFQHFNLLSSRTVQGNVELALEVIGVDPRERRRRAGEILDLVGLSLKATAYPNQLSGGQKQRVGIARALAAEPTLLLSDEATSSLDPETTRSILDLLATINAELGLTVLLITHEMDVVKTICGSAALLEHGRIVEQGSLVGLISTPGSRLARELFPLGPVPPHEGNTVIEITFSGGLANRPVISQLARTYNLDVSILGGAVETIAGNQAGRTRLELPGTLERNAKPIEDLRSQGLLVEVIGGSIRMIDPSAPSFWPDLISVLLIGTGQTLYMVGCALLVTVLIGLPLGILLVGTEKGGLFQTLFGSRTAATVLNRVLDFVINLGRSVPFIILMIAVIPFTRLVVGTFIGPTAAIVPLSLVAIPFFARMVEISLKEVGGGLTEAAHSLGASRWQIVRKVLVPEALPGMVLGLGTTVTSIINFSAMVGVVAGGGLGDVAVRYGYQRYSEIHMIGVIIIIYLIVQALAALATFGARRLTHVSS